MSAGEFLSATHGVFATPAAAGRQEVFCGFTPGLILLWTVGATAEMAPAQRTTRFSFGAVAVANRQQRVVANVLQHGEVPAGTHAGTATRTDRCLMFLTDVSALQAVTVGGEAEFLWGTATGFVLDWKVIQTGGPHRVHFFAVGGPDLGRVTIGTIIAPTSGGPLPLAQRTSIGYRARALVFFGAHRAAEVVTEERSTFCLGASEHTDLAGAPLGRNRASAVVDRNLSPTEVLQYHTTARAYVGLLNGAIDGEAFNEVIDADGFEMWWQLLPTIAARIFYVAIEGGQWRVGHHTSRTTLGTQAISSLYWGGNPTPIGALFWTGSAGSVNTLDTAASRLGLGATGAPLTGGSTQHESIDAATTSTIYAGNDEALPVKFQQAASVRAAARLLSWGPDLITLDYLTATSPALRAFFLAVGPKTIRGTVSGIARTPDGTPLAGARVDAFRRRDHAYVGTATSGADGSYAVSVYGWSQDRYYVRAYLDGSPPVFGTTAEDLVAA